MYPWPSTHSQLRLPGQFEKLGMILGMRLYACKEQYKRSPTWTKVYVCNRGKDALGEFKLVFDLPFV